MNHINTSHQGIAARQRNCNYHPNGAIAQHILDSTVERESHETIIEEDGRYLVASAKFAGRYYVVRQVNGAWQCSSRDEGVALRCIAQARAYAAKQAA